VSDRDLQNFFQFDDDDLAANRSGRLTKNQTTRLIQEKKDWRNTGFGLGIVLLVISLIFPIVYIPQAVKAFAAGEILGGLGILIMPLIWFPIWGGLGYLSLKSSIKPSSKISINRVTGPANLVAVERQSGSENSSTSIDYRLHVGKKRFDLDGDAGGVLMQGQVYTVYFTESEDDMPTDILSLERS